MDLNKVTLIGNVVRDPESRVSASGDGSQRLCRFSLATHYAWQDAKTKARKEAVDFHDCIAWGKLGEIIVQYLRKGSKVYVEGRLRKRPYVNADGQRCTANEIVADNMIMLGHRAKAPSTVDAMPVREKVEVANSEEGS